MFSKITGMVKRQGKNGNSHLGEDFPEGLADDVLAGLEPEEETACPEPVAYLDPEGEDRSSQRGLANRLKALPRRSLALVGVLLACAAYGGYSYWGGEEAMTLSSPIAVSRPESPVGGAPAVKPAPEVKSAPLPVKPATPEVKPVTPPAEANKPPSPAVMEEANRKVLAAAQNTGSPAPVEVTGSAAQPKASELNSPQGVEKPARPTDSRPLGVPETQLPVEPSPLPGSDPAPAAPSAPEHSRAASGIPQPGAPRPIETPQLPTGPSGHPSDPAALAGYNPLEGGKRLYDLEQQVQIKELELKLAQLNANIEKARKEQMAALAPPPAPPMPASPAAPPKPSDRERELEQLLAENVGLGGDGGGGSASKGGGGGGGSRRPSVSAISDSGAVINGEMVRPGGSVAGYRVVRINAAKGTVTLSSKLYGTIEIGM